MLSNGEYNDVAVALNCNSSVNLSNDTGMERIWFLSIRHTGTHYLFDHLQRLGFANGFINWSMKKVVRPDYRTNYFVHSHIEVTPSYGYKTDERCVVTMRDPVEVYRSHVYRYRWTAEEFIVHIVNSFDLLSELIEENDAHVFRVDAKDQSREVSKLADWLGVKDYRYKEISRSTHGTRGVGKCHNPELFSAEPPDVVLALSESYGYK